MGKHVIVAADGPGFLVNRCNRPLGLEALKLLQERVASLEEIDRICRLGGGFRMGPFELMDLVGVDVGPGRVAARSTSRASASRAGGRRRSRVRTVAAGRHGRKTGRGYYEYPEGGRAPAARSRAAHRPAAGTGLIVIAGALGAGAGARAAPPPTPAGRWPARRGAGPRPARS